MEIDFKLFLVGYCAIVLIYLIIMFCLLFGKFNSSVLKKSYLDTKIYLYIVSLTAILFFVAIIYTLSIKEVSTLSYIVYYSMFLAYAVSLMITLIVAFMPLRKIDNATSELALGKKNLTFDFEGASEFESIAKSLSQVQQNYRDNDKKLNRQENEYQKFVPKSYLKFFGKTKLKDVAVGDYVQVKLSTMFCDLRNSYYSSETLSLIDNFLLIKEFVDSVTTTVHKHNGFVDKYLGDGILAIFESEDDALKCANEVAKQTDYKNIVSIGKEQVNYGISLNSGMCVVGVVGHEKQKQFSVISDVVNLCSRIEGLNKLFSTRVLMPKQFISNLKGSYNFRYIGTIDFNDLTSTIPVFESLDSYVDAKRLTIQKTVDEFESGVRLFEKKDYENAKKYFVECVKNNASDNLAKIYLSKTKNEMSKQLTYSA